MYQEGRALMFSGALTDAKDKFEKAVQAFPHYKSFERLGECLLEMGLIEQAVVPLATAIGLNHHYHSEVLLAEAYVRLGAYMDALRPAESAFCKNSQNKRARRILQIIYVELTRQGLGEWPTELP